MHDGRRTPSARFSKGDVVQMRDRDSRRWLHGYVTCVEPLQVEGEDWDEVRPLDLGRLVAEDTGARRQALEQRRLREDTSASREAPKPGARAALETNKGLESSKASARSDVGRTGAKEPERLGFGAAAVRTLGLFAVMGLMLWLRRRTSGDVNFRNIMPVIVVEGKVGLNEEWMNGEYRILEHGWNRKPIWRRSKYGMEGFIMRDDCDAWLISWHSRGEAPQCRGWAYSECKDWPWQCEGSWRVWDGHAWVTPEDSFNVRAHDDFADELVSSYEKLPPLVRPGVRVCDEDTERRLQEHVADMDVIIPWINGSEELFLERRRATCTEWQWAEMWPLAVETSAQAKSCLASAAAIAEAREAATCNATAEHCEGGEVVRGLTTRDSLCFARFISEQCKNRVNTIQDHDELRYLIRSLERNMQWHRGRVLVVVPAGQRPNWFQDNGKVQIMEQDEIMRAALASELYEKAKVGLTGPSTWAPDPIFDSFPIEASLAFLPNVSRYVALLQDDLFFARPIRACDFFYFEDGDVTSVPKPWVFALPSSAADDLIADEFQAVFKALQRNTAKAWYDMHAKSPRKAHIPYKDIHLPQLLDISVMKDIWARLGPRIAVTLNSAFRWPNLTNIVALHHSELIQRAVHAGGSDPVVDLDDDGGRVPFHKRVHMEVVFTTVRDWHRNMASIPPVASKLGLMVAFQDDLNDASSADTGVLELDCLRERWLTQLFPEPSSSETSSDPPRRCENWRQRRSWR